jgi:hypothetical protein
MMLRATDSSLPRRTREVLAFTLIVDCLHAFRERQEPAVALADLQQMLRSLDDEVRANAAEALPRFLREMSAENGHPERLFRQSVRPFLEKVWPQERSLARPGVARAFAELPADAADAFAEAVDAIEKFLVPFDCWSMIDYGLYGEENGRKKLAMVDTRSKAEGLLRLLDATIGGAEGAVVPSDLGEALQQIEKTALNLSKVQSFRRLATLARR